MLLYRSFVVGLLGACCLLLAARPRPEVRLITQAPPPVAQADAPTIVDVSSRIGPVALAELLHVPPGAQIFASGPSWTYSNSYVSSAESLAEVFAQRMPAPGNFMELVIDGKRTLVLVH